MEVGIDFVTTMNTFPLGTSIDWQKESMRISPNMGIAGLAGSAVKPIALSQVILISHYTKGKLPIIGVGGITNAVDAYEFFLAGASAIQIGTALLKKSPRIFSSIKSELIELLKKKGVKRLSDKSGSLKLPKS